MVLRIALSDVQRMTVEVACRRPGLRGVVACRSPGLRGVVAMPIWFARVAGAVHGCNLAHAEIAWLTSGRISAGTAPVFPRRACHAYGACRRSLLSPFLPLSIHSPSRITGGSRRGAKRGCSSSGPTCARQLSRDDMLAGKRAARAAKRPTGATGPVREKRPRLEGDSGAAQAGAPQADADVQVGAGMIK